MRTVPFGALLLWGALATGCAGNESSGGCEPGCNIAQQCCNGMCVARDSVNHCGGCNVTCNGTCLNGTCITGGVDAQVGRDGGTPGGTCRPECPAGQRCCGSTCVERAVALNQNGQSHPSFLNCNGCGLTCDMNRASACSVPAGGAGDAAPRCMCGEFPECIAGEVCVNNGGTFGCVSLSTDANNCGTVGNRCAEGESCSGGMCVCGGTGARCGGGQACCGGSCIDIQNDAANCGACGTVCTPNAPNCVNGSCTCAASGRVCAPPTSSPLPPPLGPPSDPGESCCPEVGCVPNTDASCACMACAPDDTPDTPACQVGSGILGGLLGGGGGLPGGGGGGGMMSVTTVCCNPNPLFGCGMISFPGLPF